ncbi:MAG: ABC transporter ATP-binding protein [Victivallaceae bacterium]
MSRIYHAADFGWIEEPRPLLAVRNLCKFFPVNSSGILRRKIGEVKAVNQVSFELFGNETLGLVGESGCGKSTTVRTLLRALEFTSGEAYFDADGNGSYVELGTLSEHELLPLRRKIQMIFQDPFASLNPRMTVGEIIAEPLRIHHLAKGAELDDMVADILRKVGLKPEHRTRYPHAFSGGQRQRIGIARALVMKPKLVVADEAVSALDVSVQAQVINLLADLKHDMGLSYIFVAHDLGVVRHICDRVAVMYAGRIVEIAETETLFENPLHPYTRLLLASAPIPDPDIRTLPPNPGEVADAGNLPAGCAFAPRCPGCREACKENVPELIEAEPGHFFACFRR